MCARDCAAEIDSHSALRFNRLSLSILNCERQAMNTLIWIGQIVLAIVFFLVGAAKLFAYSTLVKTIEQVRHTAPIRISSGVGRLVGILEIAGAVGVILPAALTPAPLAPQYLLVRLAAGGLALLMVAATLYHFRRRESAVPSIASFLLALFVLVGRWPH
jgi:DoxX-like family